jgi:mono/diheme cytochrome c family protein
MKGISFWLQLILALVAVVSVLAIVQGMFSRQRAIASARATELCLVEALDEALVASGRDVYAAHCAECHGANLEGHPNWQTPLEDGSHHPLPLNNNAHAYQHSDTALLYTIKEGRNAGKLSAMPAFGSQLSEDDIRAVVEFLKSNWGTNERIQQQQLKNPQP